MATVQFMPISGETEIFDVVRDGAVVGLVWSRGEQWFADRFSMAAPKFSGSSRDEVAAFL